MLGWLWATDSSSVVPVVLRLTLAVVMFPHGAQKTFGWFGGQGFKATMRSFSTLGIPAPLGVLAIMAEFLGSLGLAVGLLTRVAALGLAAVMLVAILTVHKPHGFFVNWSGTQQGEGFEYHLLALGLAIALIIGGGGAWSLDALIAR
jgi:putative oxidoreductase